MEQLIKIEKDIKEKFDVSCIFELENEDCEFTDKFNLRENFLWYCSWEFWKYEEAYINVWSKFIPR